MKTKLQVLGFKILLVAIIVGAFYFWFSAQLNSLIAQPTNAQVKTIYIKK